MSKRSTDESLRKPRVVYGTPMNRLTNLIALGIFACSGVCWYLYEKWPQSQQLYKSILDGKFDDTPEMKYRLDSMRYMMKDPAYYQLIVKLQKRNFERENPAKEKPWYVKYLQPDPEDE